MNVFINDWHLISDQNHLSKNGTAIDIQPLCLRLLAHLARYPGEVISQEKLIEHVWSGRFVSEDAIYNCIRKLRHHLGDCRKNPEIIQTVNGQGYRLVAEVKSAKKNSRPITKSLFRYGIAVSIIVSCLSVIPFHFKVYSLHDEMTAQQREEIYWKIIQSDDKAKGIVQIKIPSVHKTNPTS